MKAMGRSRSRLSQSRPSFQRLMKRKMRWWPIQYSPTAEKLMKKLKYFGHCAHTCCA
jgi:hypothetical protein